MNISAMSGNELYCLHLKGFSVGGIVVGNSVCSLDLNEAMRGWSRGFTGGEIQGISGLISEGRHVALARLEKIARESGAVGVTRVASDMTSMSGYTEFLSQGTSVHGESPSGQFFSSAASGMELYCQLDAGYHPVRLVMGSVAYALGSGGLTRLARTVGRGEIADLSAMYNHIRHLALQRLRQEAHRLGANAVVDVRVRLLPYGPTALELLLTGTASRHAGLYAGAAEEVVTSQLSGEELWNLARMGLVPVQMVTATAVHSLGLVGGLGSVLRKTGRGELPELTSLVASAREGCLAALRREAMSYGADQVIGIKLLIRDISYGMVEVVAVGTAVRRAPDMEPKTAALIPQATIVDRDSLAIDDLTRSEPEGAARAAGGASALAGGLLAFVLALMVLALLVCGPQSASAVVPLLQE